MDAISHLALILWMFLSIPLLISLGRALTWTVLREQVKCSQALCYVTGLLAYLLVVFLLLLSQAPWPFATFTPFLLLLLGRGSFGELFRYSKPNIGLLTSLWFVIILSLSLTLFEVQSGIVTPWKNNYGDLSFHVGMISSFLWGKGFPPEYHLFAGGGLSYPFFVNLWSVTYWWIAPTWENLSTIFSFQWCVLWTVVYFSLSGVRYPLLPYALLLGGGAYAVLGNNSGQLIDQGYGWTSLLSTVWVTQRSALFGAAVAAVVVRAYLEWREEQFLPRRLFLLGLLVGSMPLVHTHIGLVTGLFLLILVSSDAVSAKKGRGLLLYLVGASLSLVFLPLLLGKVGTLTFISGWTTGKAKGWQESFLFWCKNGSPVFIGVILLWFTLGKKANTVFVALGLLFLLGNVIQLSVWDWDQIKVFLALYVLVLVFWSTRNERRCWYLHWLLPLVFFPGLYEGYVLLRDARQYTVYDTLSLKAAEIVRQNTNPGDIIAAPSDHNSPVTLTGRSLYFGYEGTLRSHGLDYLKRRRRQKNLRLLAECRESGEEICPDYIYFPLHQNRKEWSRKDVEENFTSAHVSGLWRYNARK